MQNKSKKQIGKEIILTDKVTKSFGKFQALRGITSKIYEKEVVVIFGPTGSGKSTSLAAMIDHINTTRNEHILTIEDIFLNLNLGIGIKFITCQ